MDEHRYEVTVSGCTVEQANQVMSERVNHDEDYGFNYQISHGLPFGHIIHTFADLSTAHLPQPEMQNIVTGPVRAIEHEYGAWVNVPSVEDDPDTEEWEEFPALHKVLAWAREKNARWINFDADAETTEDLPTWDW